MKIESSEFEHGRVYFKQFGAERVKYLRAYFIILFFPNKNDEIFHFLTGMVSQKGKLFGVNLFIYLNK